jgi:hypothetical protein
MIVNIRGTSGSGKSHVVRTFFDSSLKTQRVPENHYKEGRKQPLMTTYVTEPGQAITRIGHYNTACGGCDTITNQDEVFELVRKVAELGNHVVFEGLLISAEFNRTLALAQSFGNDFHVIALTTPLDVCIAGIQQRRTDRGDERPINPKNTTSKFKGVAATCKRLEANGVLVHRLDRDEAAAKMRELLT